VSIQSLKKLNDLAKRKGRQNRVQRPSSNFGRPNHSQLEPNFHLLGGIRNSEKSGCVDAATIKNAAFVGASSCPYVE
jgi:hypothetical protein